MRVVAEGVENRETLDQLRELGCDEAQGYFVAKPLTGERLQEWVTTSPWRPVPVS
jgi:EAL domain-containing protein (putative c-di-GMP-specific phosphodiesterase class I)